MKPGIYIALIILLLTAADCFGYDDGSKSNPKHRTLTKATGELRNKVHYTYLNRQLLFEYEKLYQLESDSSRHTAIKPYQLRERPAGLLYKEYWKDSIGPSLLKKRFFNNYPIRLSGNGHISPMVNISPGHDLASSEMTLQTEAGIAIEGTPNWKFGWRLGVLGGRSTFPSYLDSVIDNYRVVPGFGRAYGSKGTYSYQKYFGYLAYSPNRVFNIQAGQDKHFWGDGYRSLFLSDHTGNYPFLKISTTIWRFKYVNMYARFTDMFNGWEKSNLQPKYGTFHYLSYNATKWLNISVFESIVWQGSDTNRTRNFDINYLSPVVFFRPVEYSVGSSDNAFLGGSIKIKLWKRYQFYSQVLLDEFLLAEVRARRGWWGNKHGIQAGFKAFDLFGAKGLYLQAEYNTVLPFTYAHGSPRQSYSHLALPLAHPLGANFKEVIGFLGYRYKRWQLEGKLLYAQYGRDSVNSNYGGNVLLSYSSRSGGDYGHFTGQGLAAELAIADLRIAYVLNPVNNLQLELRVCERITSTIAGKEQHPFVQLGLKTALWNVYDDF